MIGAAIGLGNPAGTPGSVSTLRAALYAVPLAKQHVAILGDSNAYGNGDTDHADDRNLITAYPNVRITQKLGLGDPFVAEYDIADRSLQPFRAGGAASMGIELAFGRALDAAGRTATKLSVWAARGSSLGTEWQAGFPATVNTFLDAQVVTYGAIGTVYLDIGTNDSATWANANSWQKNATTLVDALRARYGLFLLVVRMTSRSLDAGYPYWETVREQQAAYVNSDPLAILLDVDDVPLSDGLHFVANNYSVIGYRAAAEIIATIGVAETAYAGSFPEYVGSVAGISGAGTLTPLSFPVPNNDGSYFDILVVATGIDAAGAKATLTEAAGFVEIGSDFGTVAVVLIQWITIFYRRCTSRRMGNPVVADGNAFNAAKIFTFRQPTTKSGSPIDASTISHDDVYDTAVSIAGVTTTGANRLIALFLADYSGGAATLSGWTNAALGSITENQDNVYTVVSDYEVITCVTGTKAATGATGATTATASGSIFGGQACLAFKP